MQPFIQMPPTGLRFPYLNQEVERIEHLLIEKHAILAPLFRSCLLNTLHTTVQPQPDGTTFVITGDIPAMWLRDSSAQVRPYIRYAAHDGDLRQVLRGVIRRQVQYLTLDPYANAFNRTPDGSGHQDDQTDQNPWLWERKYELDSLCYPVQLIADYWQATGDASIFNEEVRSAFTRILDVIETEQRHDERSPYRFQRFNCPPSDTLPNDGRGTPTAYTGMSWSGFRPSDDACTFGYLIPANMFAVVILGHVTALARAHYDDEALAARAERLRAEIDNGIQTHGIVQHPTFGPIYAYEVDGLGGVNLMDDANVPNLLSIPYLGYRPASDPIVQNTRRFVLSDENPYFQRGTFAEGIGSPHTPDGYLWHIGLIMQALSATDAAERDRLIDMIVRTTGGTNYMHESFDPNDPTQYTRPWFAWANSLFAELILTIVDQAPANNNQKDDAHGG